MEDEHLTDRELHHLIRDIKDDVKEIKIQTKITNGRVSALENWRWAMVGGGVVIIGTVVPLIIYIWNQTI